MGLQGFQAIPFNYNPDNRNILNYNRTIYNEPLWTIHFSVLHCKCLIIQMFPNK